MQIDSVIMAIVCALQRCSARPMGPSEVWLPAPVAAGEQDYTCEFGAPVRLNSECLRKMAFQQHHAKAEEACPVRNGLR